MKKQTYNYPCFVYVLASVGAEKPTTYVGWTVDLNKRLLAHNAGTGAKSTRGRQWAIIHSEAFKTRCEAMSREWHLKRDRKLRKSLLETYLKAQGLKNSLL
ncbi:GIY-YIG nuclease family protein [Kordiimonas pumila]|uniref:GIY-YIG nuclease family protein n=1 Tax=Kordiimonas pumila TaxID=2161677 RepID=A0ABV7D1C7_9PROT